MKKQAPRMKRLWVVSCCPTGISLDDRLTRRIHRGTPVQAAGSFLPLPLPHHHELHQDLSQGNLLAHICSSQMHATAHVHLVISRSVRESAANPPSAPPPLRA